MDTVLWVVGAPGVGKTTAVRALLVPFERTIIKSPKWTLAGPIAAAGHYTGETFDGADTVPYNGAADCLAAWKNLLRKKAKLTVFDGDRFSNKASLEFFQNLHTKPLIVCAYIKASGDTLQKRRDARGSNQNATWLKGRATKAERFAGLFTNIIEIDGERSSTMVAADIIAGLRRLGCEVVL